jgi:tetratricopeptide (TPR) repeat protein
LHESADAFNKEFQAWLDQQTGDTVRHFDDWKKGMAALSAALKNNNDEAVLQQSAGVERAYPEYVGQQSEYELTAEFFLSKGKKTQALQQLEQYRNRGGTSVASLKTLARLEQESGNAKEAEHTLAELNYIYPEDEEVHRTLGNLLLVNGDANRAVREFSAVLSLKPSDTAESHYNLAKALQAAHRTDEAKDQVVMALEAAPDFKPAQQLLLQLNP